MAAAATEAPVRDALAWILDDAIRYREPQADDCGDCTRVGGPCGDHEGDQAIAGAVSALLGAVESAAGDDEAIAALRVLCPQVLAEIAAAADDDAEGGARDDG